MSPPRPNIMLLVGEDTGRLHGCYGNPVAHTPHTNLLAAKGCRYTNGFSHAPVCAPSRAGIITGCYPQTLGNFHMRCRLQTPPRCFTHDLQDAGYHVNWHSKTDFNFDPPGDFATTTEPWRESLAADPPTQPWFVFTNFFETHESGVWDVGQSSHNDGYAQRTASLPDHLRTDPDKVHVPAYLPDTPLVRRDIARNLDCLAVQDMELGRCRTALERSGQAENTIIIYTSDHGRGLPREKRWCYDAGVHLPLIIHIPPALQKSLGIAGGYNHGGTCDQLVAWVDLAPTILALCGLDKRQFDRMDGQVFLGPQRDAPRGFVLGGRDRMDANFDRTRYCRSQRYHYIQNDFPDIPWMARLRYMDQGNTCKELRRLRREGTLAGPSADFMSETKPPEELYDALADPDMVRNLADDPAYSGVLQTHREALAAWREQHDRLAAITEEQLVADGVPHNQIDEYRQRVEPQDPADRLGKSEPSVTLREHEAWQAAQA